MSESVELLVALKIPDVTAVTARQALQRRMGYGQVLADLRRADWWRLELDVPGPAAALALGRELAEQTNCFVNPNKHVYECVARVTPPPAGDGARAVCVLTGFRDEALAELTAQALRGRLGYGERIAGLEHGTLWTLTLNEPDAARARELAERMTLSDRRDSGLLANPHSMWWRLVE